MKKETFIKAWARELSVSEDDLYDFYNKVIIFENQMHSAGEEQEECPECKGHGWLPRGVDDSMECPYCTNGLEDKGNGDVVDCSHCDGSGEYSTKGRTLTQVETILMLSKIGHDSIAQTAERIENYIKSKLTRPTVSEGEVLVPISEIESFVKVYNHEKGGKSWSVNSFLTGLNNWLKVKPPPQQPSDSAGEESSEKEIWKPGMDLFAKRVDKFFEDSPQFGPTKAQLYGAWHESFDIILSKLTRPTVSEEEIEAILKRPMIDSWKAKAIKELLNR